MHCLRSGPFCSQILISLPTALFLSTRNGGPPRCDMVQCLLGDWISLWVPAQRHLSIVVSKLVLRDLPELKHKRVNSLKGLNCAILTSWIWAAGVASSRASIIAKCENLSKKRATIPWFGPVSRARIRDVNTFANATN
jgi:hypothetical protein